VQSFKRLFINLKVLKEIDFLHLKKHMLIEQTGENLAPFFSYMIIILIILLISENLVRFFVNHRYFI
jgi:hypothetical protein